jgi:hypothetical protein
MPRISRLAWPFPEIVHDLPWTVLNSTRGVAYCNTTEATLAVPLIPDRTHRFVRAHELTHAVISPNPPPPYPKNITVLVVALEELRVNNTVSTLLNIPGPDVNSEFAIKDVHTLCKGTDTDAVCALMASRFRPYDYNRILDKTTPEQESLADAAFNRMWPEPDILPPFQNVIDTAKWLANILAKTQDGLEESEDPLDVFDNPARALKAPKSLAEAIADSSDPEDSTIPESTPTPTTPKSSERLSKSELRDMILSPHEPTSTLESILESISEPAQERTFRAPTKIENILQKPEPPSPHIWGDMKILRPALTRPSVEALEGVRKRRSTAEGDIPTAMHRLCTDKAIFQVYRKGRSFTCLIDVSGSMDLTYDDLQSFLDVAPLSTVAIYSGGDTRDRLTVIASRGMKVSPMRFREISITQGGLNRIDGPALRWLTHQPGPRMWICDGHVTVAKGRDREQSSTSGSLECLQLCADFAIVQATDLNDALKLTQDSLYKKRLGHYNISHTFITPLFEALGFKRISECKGAPPP